MRRLIGGAHAALGWTGALFSVLSAIALVVWLVAALDSASGLFAKSSLDGKLVLTLLLALVATLIWGWRRGAASRHSDHHTHLPPLAKGGEETVEGDITPDGKLRLKRRAL